jgi:uncharacterized protein with PQ loop repeat
MMHVEKLFSHHTVILVPFLFSTYRWLLTCYLAVGSNWSSAAARLIGNAAVVFCMLLFASPLSALKTVLQTKSAQSIPLPMTLATVLNCFLWSVAGLKDFNDFTVYFPNLVGLGLGLSQVGLKLIYGNGAPAHTSTMTKAEAEIELSM